MPKKCQIDNCSCCFHKQSPAEPVRPRGRPVIVRDDTALKCCITCHEMKSVDQMRKGRNKCRDCYNNLQKEYYKKNDYYKKYKLKNKSPVVQETLVPDDLISGA
jgi:hypothetical protein